MGQIVLGVMYGTRAPGVGSPWDPDGPLAEGGYSFLERWERASGEGRRKYKIEASHPDASPLVIGYWVVCEHGDENGVADIDGCLRLDAIKRGKPHAKAKAHWKRFAAWARKHGVKLPAPTLWLAPTEVA
jgi:hypothetical protein